jgi:crossover junction endodeoxyribonuclease RuvC
MLYARVMRIIGVDPGLSTTGIGLVEAASGKDPVAVEWLTITTETALPLPQRLTELARDLKTFVAETEPTLAVVERVFFATNRRTAIDTAQARGAILVVLEEYGIPVIEVAPLELKMAITGDGKADKKQVQSMVMRTLKLKECPSPADAADALALALVGAFRSRGNRSHNQ